MTDVSAPPETPAARQAAEDLRRLLADLGTGADIVGRVQAWADLGGRGYVYVPPLPASVVAHLARLLPAGAVS